jgi:DNA-nicking Smr family endonuclease
MTRWSRSRALRPEERRLWAQVARGVTPLGGRIVPPEPVADAPPPENQAPPTAPAAPRPVPALRQAVPALAPVERKTLRALRRGHRGVEAVIDLHGMRQDEAHAALVGFLHRSQQAGRGLVLVVTGKGAPGADGAVAFEERGVLRRVVPHWLRLPDLRSLVLGFDAASPQHGGTGALYVRLRRRRGAGADR